MCGSCGLSFSGFRLSGVTGWRAARATGFITAGVALGEAARCRFVDTS